jgi:hypothetical protein
MANPQRVSEHLSGFRHYTRASAKLLEHASLGFEIAVNGSDCPWPHRWRARGLRSDGTPEQGEAGVPREARRARVDYRGAALDCTSMHVEHAHGLSFSSSTWSTIVPVHVDGAIVYAASAAQPGDTATLFEYRIEQL